MRKEYVELVKEYLHGRPDYKRNLDEVTANLLAIGATEQEIREGIEQFEKMPPPSHHIIHQKVSEATPTNQPEEKPPRRMNKLLELDIITHVAVILVVVLFAVAFSSPYLLAKYQSVVRFITNTKTKPIDAGGEGEKIAANNLIPQVYANASEIDANQVFSYPQSDITLKITGTPKKEIFGFLPYWMMGVADKMQFDPVTTVSLFGIEMDGRGNITTAYTDGKMDGGWAMLNDPKLTTLIAKLKRKRIKTQITLKAFNKTNIETLVQSDAAHKTFISNAMYIVNAKNLDGINLDFEYVGTPSKKVMDGFTRLVTNLNDELKRQFPDATLTICTYITSGSMPGLFDLEQLALHSNAFVVMGYDIHTPSGSAGPIAPMNGAGYNITNLMQNYLEKVSPDQLILAVPFYGYSWSTSGETGVLPYAQLAEVSKENKIQWDDVSQTPMYKYLDPATNATHEVHFENVRSLGIKFDYINKKDLKGVGIWALGYDGNNTDIKQLLIEKFAQ